MKQNIFINNIGLHRVVLAILMPAMLVSQGCIKRVFEDRPIIKDGRVEITLEWESTATAKPLAFAFYNEKDGSLYNTFDGTSEGYNGILPIGEYKIIAYDKSALNIGYCNMESYDTAEAYALENKSKAVSPMILEPGDVYSVANCVDMTKLVIVGDKTLKAVAKPTNKTRLVNMLLNITNGESITSITGLMDGVSPSISLSTGKTIDFSATLPFSVNPSVEGKFNTNINLFNFTPTEVGTSDVNTMEITLKQGDNIAHKMTIDLTETIRDIIINNGGVIPIEIPIEIAIDMTDLNNITATVKPWIGGGAGGGDIVGKK